MYENLLLGALEALIRKEKIVLEVELEDGGYDYGKGHVSVRVKLHIGSETLEAHDSMTVKLKDDSY